MDIELIETAVPPPEAAQQSAPPPDSADVAAPCVSVVMPTHTWSGCFETCARSALERVSAGDVAGRELIVVFDGVHEPPPDWLVESGAVVLSTGARSGPAHARNLGANAATGNVLFFVDSDVELAPEAVERVHARFAAAPDLVALFGTYDDAPACDGTVSRFRNLLHHHTHVSHPGRAGTFWSGCGAIRAAAFHDLAGFDESFLHPSVEDIELGMRVRGTGGRIELDPALRCKHHKSWTLRSMVTTDIFQRAVPWTRLILESGEVPATLNLDWGNRACGAAAVLAVAALPAAALTGRWSLLAAVPLLLTGMAWMHHDFYRLCLRHGGPGFALASFALHGLFYFYSTLTFAWVVAATTLGRWFGSPPERRP